MDDFALLNRYTKNGDEAAFTQLVERYIGMVFGTALRRTGSRELAEEISQSVFTILAEKASKLKPGTIISGWLHRTAVLQAAHAMRTEQRRIKRMKEFSEIVSPQTSHSSDSHAWNDVSQIIDESMNQLSDADRNVLFLRFSEERNYREIGKLLGKSESATQRHTIRALNKLGSLLQKKGVVLPLATLATGLTTELGKAATAPLGLSASISKLALSGSLTTTTASLFTTFTIMTSSIKTSTIILSGCALFALSTSGGILLKQINQDNDAKLSQNAHSNELLHNTQQSPTKSVSLNLAEDASGRTFPGEATNEKNKTIRLLDKVIKIAKAADELDAAKISVRTLLVSLSAHEMVDGLDYLSASKEPNEIRLFITKELFHRWGVLDPLTAMEAALATKSPSELISNTRTVAQSWAETDPQAAFNWYKQMKNSNDHSINSGGAREIIAGIMKGAVRHDIETGFSMIENLNPDEKTAIKSSLNNFAKDNEMRAAVSDRMTKISDEVLKIQMTRGFAENWAQSNIREAAEWFGQIEFEEPTTFFRNTDVIGELYFKQNPREAIDWIHPKIPDEMKMRIVRGIVGKQWAQRDREAAVLWLRENHYDPDEIIK